jgi:uncharacterized protein
MPDFADPFSGLAPAKSLGQGELTRALRLDIAAELEAIHLYEAQSDATDDPLVAAVLRDIANEERVHVGELQQLLRILLPDEEGFLQDGAAEVEAMRSSAVEPTGAEADIAAPVATIGSLR